jgi:hypothetical protein
MLNSHDGAVLATRVEERTLLMPGRLSHLRLPVLIGLALAAVGATFGAVGSAFFAAASGAASAAALVSTTAASAPVSIALPGDRAFPESLAATKDGTLAVETLKDGFVTPTGVAVDLPAAH